MENEKRLIDANAMRQDWLENGENEFVYDTNAVLDSIDAQPTIEAEPVVHAYWQIYNESGDWRCSHCKVYHFHNGAMIKKYKRCPNCGAKMDGGKDD